MGGGHNQIIIAHPGLAAAPVGSRTEGGIFANLVAIADDEIRLLTLVLQILRSASHDGSRVNLVILTKFHPAIHNDMRTDDCAVSDFRVRTDYGVRTDLNIHSQFCLWIHNCRRVYISCQGYYFLLLRSGLHNFFLLNLGSSLISANQVGEWPSVFKQSWTSRGI